MRISLCTTCHNRAYQFKQVFDQNLSAVLNDADVEWVILNYNSNDDLDSFMLSRLSDANGKIVYAREKTAQSWHSSIAKNISHKIASGDALMNLDCDNYIGNALEIIRSKLRGNLGGLHLWSGWYGDGTYGRIVVRKQHFFAAGGYDESFYPMAHQDTDLLYRLCTMGIEIRQYLCEREMALTNTKADSILHCRTGGMTWEQFYIANRNKSLANLRASNLIANIGHEWGAGDLEIVTRQT
jgi:glycosyltransferase involved in cell wall biosynthesis